MYKYCINIQYLICKSFTRMEGCITNIRIRIQAVLPFIEFALYLHCQNGSQYKFNCTGQKRVFSSVVLYTIYLSPKVEIKCCIFQRVYTSTKDFLRTRAHSYSTHHINYVLWFCRFDRLDEMLYICVSSKSKVATLN